MLSWHPQRGSLKPTYGFKHALLNDKQILNCITSHCWSPIVFKGGHRLQNNFIKSKYIGLDFDGDERELTIEQAIENVFCDLKCFIGPTKSHRKEKNGKIADRFRVLIELEDYITDIRTYRYMVKHLSEFYGSDTQCKDAARFFYPCSEIVAVIDGEPQELIDVPNDFENQVSRDNYLRYYKELGTMPPKLKLKLTRPIEKGSRNSTFYGVAKDLKKLGCDQQEVVAYILNSPTYGNDSKYENEIKATVASAFRDL